jgi:BASS family bile acid:Na+ symporter
MALVVNSLTNAFTLAFVLTSMFGLGLGLTMREIVQPLADLGLAARALLANFVVVPGIAWALTRLLPLDQDLRIGLLLMSAVAGAPLALKATQIARGDVRFAVALVALQVVASVIYLPLVLPWLIPGIAVNAVALAIPLVLQILLPLGLGLVVNIRYEEEAEMARPIMSEIANLSLAALLLVNLANVGQVLGLLGTGAFAAALGVIVLALVVGYQLGGPTRARRRALALGTGQRNYAAAFVIAEGSFGDRPTVMLMLLAASLVSIVILMLAAGELGRRAKARGEVAVEHQNREEREERVSA